VRESGIVTKAKFGVTEKDFGKMSKNPDTTSKRS
jgi:hypothetical protein